MVNCILNNCKYSFIVGGLNITSHTIKIKSNSLEKLLEDLVLFPEAENKIEANARRWDITTPNEHLISDPKGILHIILKLLGEQYILSEVSGTYSFLGSLEIIHQFNHEIKGLSIYSTDEGISIWAEAIKNNKDFKNTEITITLNK